MGQLTYSHNASFYVHVCGVSKSCPMEGTRTVKNDWEFPELICGTTLRSGCAREEFYSLFTSFRSDMETSEKGVNSCHVKKNYEINGTEDNGFWEEIKDFPNSFQMKDQEQLGSDIMKRIRNGLDSSISVGYKTPLETARVYNLLAFLLFRLRQPKEALEKINSALAAEGKYENIVSLANKAIILRKMGFDSESKQQLGVLEGLKLKGDHFNYLVIKAKAELAFSYTRFGPKFFNTAIAAFEEILPQAKEPEKPLWTFGLALTLRRAMHLQFTPRTESLEDVSARNYRILSLLQEVVDGSDASLRAKAYAEMGLLLNNNRRDVALHQAAGVKTAAEACEKALELDDADNSVLAKSSRIFRYSKYKLEYCLELLLKADSFRHSSTVYHHIALTYKAMQTDKKYHKDLFQSYDSKVRPNRNIRVHHYNYHERDRRYSQVVDEHHCREQVSLHFPFNTGLPASGDRFVFTGKCNNTVILPKNVNEIEDTQHSLAQMSLITVQNEKVDMGATCYKATPTSVEVSVSRDSKRVQSNDLEIKRLQSQIKSPTQETRFSWDDEYVPKVIEYLNKAIEFSGEENTRAMYDLALMYKALGEYQKALDILQKLRCIDVLPEGSIDRINAFEQSGVILEEMIKIETSEERKQILKVEKRDMFNRALSLQSNLYSRNSQVQGLLGVVWHSFEALFSEVDQCDKSKENKLKEKAKLLHLIRKHKESSLLLQELESMSSKEEIQADFLEMRIKNCVELGQYSDAVTALDLMKLVKDKSHEYTVLESFKDKNFVQKIYLEAGRQTFLGDSSAATSAQEHFRSAFCYCFERNQQASSSSEDTNSTDGLTSDITWDVMVIHDSQTYDQIKTAHTLARFLQKSCGLLTTRLEEDAPTGPEEEGVLAIMKRSKMVVVVAGEEHPSKEFRTYIRHASHRPSTVLLLMGGDHVPKLLKRHRSMTCPPDLLDMVLEEREQYSEGQVNIICNLMCFFMGI